ncbi:MAG TPA: hypothetical protein VN026_02845, partial [Bacteroidia bacterium]|nr:hypothetical protein [Bacteroidia bacterium]
MNNIIKNINPICTHRATITDCYQILLEDDDVILGYGKNSDGDIIIQSILEEDDDLKCYFHLYSIITKEILDSFLKKEISYLEVLKTSNEIY